MTESTPSPPVADQPRAWLRRLPLLGVVLLVLPALTYLDHLLQREYRAAAFSQAIQTDALLESTIGHRVVLLHALDVLLATARSPTDAHDRFVTFARQMIASAPDIVGVYHVELNGTVSEAYPGTAVPSGLAPGERFRLADSSSASRQALESGHAVASPIVLLPQRVRGVLVYEPVPATGGGLDGFVVAAVAQEALIGTALGDQLRGQFAYRITDDAGQVIALSPEYPQRAASLIHRDVEWAGDRAWGLDVAVEPFQPLTPRLIMWVAGLLLLTLIVLVVVREDARAERFAMHSLKLELLSRNLLDANVRLEERAQQIAEANRAKSRFLANVSHELRTPLNAIVGYNSLALSGLYGDSTAELTTAHERIRSASEHLLGLVNDILDLSKIEVGRMEVDVRAVDVARVIDEVVAAIEPIADAKGLRVDVVVDRDLPLVHTDERHLRQVLLNLAANAVKFTERGAVTISARVGADPGAPPHLHIDVEDTGIGIAEEDTDRIFEEFEQVNADGRGDSAHRGTGLGLALARKLARLLGGTVTVQSRLGAGSRFTIVLPISGPPPAPLGDGDLAHDVGAPVSPPTAERPARPMPSSSSRSTGAGIQVAGGENADDADGADDADTLRAR